MLMLDLIIILYHLKLDKFYCIRAMNYLKMICYDLLFCSYKNESLLFNRQKLLLKAKNRYHMVVVKKKLLNIT